MGVIHKQAGRLDDAVAAYECAFALAPCYDTIRANLAIAYSDQGTRCRAAGDTSAGVSAVSQHHLLFQRAREMSLLPDASFCNGPLPSPDMLQGWPVQACVQICTNCQ